MTLPPPGDKRWAMLAEGVRRILIQALGLWEDFWGLPRSIEPRRKRKQQSHNPRRETPAGD